MSIAVLNSTYGHLPALRDSIAALPDKRRPGWANTVVVALLLADRYQDKRGYVDETVTQVAEALCLSENTVRSVLTALDQVGFWRRTVKGNQYRGSRRVPAFMQRGADPSSLDAERVGADPTVLDESDGGASRGSRPSIAGYTPEQRGADPTTPHHPLCTSPKEREATCLVGQYADEVPSLIEGLNITHGQAAVREVVEEFMTAGARFAFPSDLAAALKAKLTGLTSFDLADTAPVSLMVEHGRRRREHITYEFSSDEGEAPVVSLTSYPGAT